MRLTFQLQHPPWTPQFSLRTLFEYVTVCAVILALSPATGIMAGTFLMLFALTLWMRLGWLAVGALMAASVTADLPLDAMDDGMSVIRQSAVIALAALISIWYRFRGGFRPNSRRK